MLPQLRDLKFSPQICKRSRDIAATVEQLPLRIGKLVKIQLRSWWRGLLASATNGSRNGACWLGCHRKANQDKLRHELARAEFADVTFQPKINSRSKAMSRSVANLTRYVRASHVHTQRSMLRLPQLTHCVCTTTRAK